jgi:Staphylococcal nuclease homologue
MASEAQKTLESVALHRHLRLKETMTDSYGRVLAIAIIEDFPAWIGYMTKSFDPLLNRMMVKQGLARHFSSGSNYDNLLNSGSNIAKKSKLGIFSDTCRSVIPKNNCTIKGNLRSNIKTYYLPSCEAYDQVIVDEAYGDKWFCTESDAIQAEYIKSGRCN